MARKRKQIYHHLDDFHLDQRRCSPPGFTAQPTNMGRQGEIEQALNYWKIPSCPPLQAQQDMQRFLASAGLLMKGWGGHLPMEMRFPILPTFTIARRPAAKCLARLGPLQGLAAALPMMAMATASKVFLRNRTIMGRTAEASCNRTSLSRCPLISPRWQSLGG